LNSEPAKHCIRIGHKLLFDHRSHMIPRDRPGAVSGKPSNCEMAGMRDSETPPASTREPSLPTLQSAITLAVEAHGARDSKSEQAELLRAFLVMAALETEAERMTAVLHAVLRSAVHTLDDLRQRGYPEEILAALDGLTRRSGESDQRFIERASANRITRRVMVAEMEEKKNRRHVTLTTPRLILRELREDDWPDIHRYASDPEVVQHLDWGPKTEQETRADIAAAIARRQAIPRADFFLVVTLRPTGQLIGGCGLTIDNQNITAATLGFTFNKDFWGQGYATESAAALLQFGFERLTLHRITATCDPQNLGSCRVLEKLGMQREAHLRATRWRTGQWRDSLVYGILRNEWHPPERTA
jgi:ribosomal-protein-alanine N-acetyltransferase